MFKAILGILFMAIVSLFIGTTGFEIPDVSAGSVLMMFIVTMFFLSITILILMGDNND